MGQFMSTDFVRQNSPGILRSKKPRHRIKLLGKTRDLNLIKRKKKKKPEEQNIWRHIWGRSNSFLRTDGSSGNTENGSLAKLLFCICLVLSSSLKCSRSASSFSVWRVPTTVTSTETISAPISIRSRLCVPTLCTYHLHFQIRAAISDAAVGKNKSQSFPFTGWLIGVGHNIQINRSLVSR